LDKEQEDSIIPEGQTASGKRQQEPFIHFVPFGQIGAPGLMLQLPSFTHLFEQVFIRQQKPFLHSDPVLQG
jgi:hypothetical protein